MESFSSTSITDFFNALSCPDEKIENWPMFYNHVLRSLMSVSPIFPPVSQLQLLPINAIKNNQYNPNKMATPESKLLYISIEKDGMTMPIVVTYGERKDEFILIDGFHRYELVKNNQELQQIKGYIPAVIIEKSTLEERMASSVRHNVARGSHQVELSSSLVMQMKAWSKRRICTELGMDKDELLRLKQVSGQAEYFKNEDFSSAWE